MTRALILPATLLVATLLAAAPLVADPSDADWSEVAQAEDGGCSLSVIGNGQFFRIDAEGLGAGEAGRYFVTNGDMQPIDWAIRADGAGRFARYYLPFRWHRPGGTVTIAVTSESCRLSTAFDWHRAAVRVR